MHQCYIYGTRYTCRQCPDYDLCFKCFPRVKDGVHALHELKVAPTASEVVPVNGRIGAAKLDDVAESEEIYRTSSPVSDNSD